MSDNREPHGYGRWMRYASDMLDSQRRLTATDLVNLQERAVSAFAFDIEKDMCAVLGRQFHPGAQSIDSLLAEIRQRIK